MATKRGFAGWRSISKVEEASFDGGATIASTFRNAADPGELVLVKEDGTELVGSGAEEANEEDILARFSRLSEDLPRLRPNEAALYLAYLCGNLNQSPANEPASGYRTHTISWHPITYTVGAQDGSSTPLSSIDVEDTSSFPSSGTLVNPATGNEFAYTGKTSSSFTGMSVSDNLADNAELHIKLPNYDYLQPSFSVLDYIGAANKVQWDGVSVRSFFIEGSRRGFARAGGQLQGSGTSSNPSTSRPTELQEVYLRFGDLTVNIGGTWNGRSFSSGTDLRAKLRSFRWEGSVEMPDDLVYAPGGGDKPTKAERLRRRQSLQLGLEFENHTEHNWVVNQNSLNLKIGLAGSSGSYAVNLVFPKFRFNHAPITGGTGVLLTSPEAAVQHDPLYGSFLAQVINQQVDYLHA